MESAILSSVVRGIIPRLSSAAVREVARFWGVDEELSGLEGTILTIKAVLDDAEEKEEIHSNQDKVWLSRLEDAVNEADGLVEKVYAEALRQQAMTGNNTTKKVGTFFSTSNQLGFRQRMMNRKIERIKKKLVEIRDDKNFHLEKRHRESTQLVYRPRDHTHSFVSPKDEIIGRGDDSTKILELLLETTIDHKENVLVVPIVGSGGLGKTALARHVYTDEKVRKRFDLRMCVCVSDRSFDVKLLVGKIITSIDNNVSVENQDMELLQKKLRELISGKRYLLVLDDVWNENDGLWSNLETLLLSGAGGSRIIVTTRSQSVAKVMAPRTKPYNLRKLDDDDSWSFFKQMAFEERQEPSNSNMVEIGKKIVKRCGGNPLAIRTIGRRLYSEDQETEWSSFYDREFSEISREENNILPTLKLSYDHLSSSLKNCFAYCSLFPKDHLINVEDLKKLWMAQGFIKVSDTTTQSLDDEGHKYFMELYQRSFFQDIEEDAFGEIVYCKMHDLMHDLATEVAGVECVLLPPSENAKYLIDRRSRHLSFDFWLKSPEQIPSCLSQTQTANARIRTILLPSQSPRRVEGTGGMSFRDVIVSNFMLRTLDLHDTGIKTLPNCIGKLKHLRYLDLSRTEIRALPKNITKLQNLQTLKLSGLEGFRELPRDITKLVNLRHLEMTMLSGLTHMPHGMGQMTNLQTLTGFVLVGKHLKKSREVGELKDLMPLNNLRGQLHIINLNPRVLRDGSVANLKEKQYLQSLALEWQDAADCEMTLESLQPHPNLKQLMLCHYGGISLSSWLPSLKNLIRLRLEKCEKCQTLPPLDQFPSLKMVELKDMPAMEYISNEDSYLSKAAPLPSLQKLEFRWLPNLKGWWRRKRRDNVVVTEEEEDGQFTEANCVFPCLSFVEIMGCPEFKFIPLSPSITRLSLENPTWMPFHQTMMTIMTSEDETSSSLSITSSHSAASTPLPPVVTSTLSQLISNLTDLGLYEIEDLPSLPDWFISLISLRAVLIISCSKLKYLSPNIQHLSKLEELWIWGCDELDMSNNEEVIAWQAHKNLLHLYLGCLPKLETLPEGLQYFTTLQRLFIEECKNLMAIPEWISGLASLKWFDISKCPNLKSLPEAIRSITTLQELTIRDCPILCRRCQREEGEDWPKIAHIPYLDVKDDSQSSVSSSGVSHWKISRRFRAPQLCNK